MEDLAENYVGIPMEGTFLVYDCISDALESAASDGVPRYGICVTDQLRKICVSTEGVRSTAALYLMPDPCSPWFYLNTVSSVGGSDTRKISTSFPRSSSAPLRVARKVVGKASSRR